MKKRICFLVDSIFSIGGVQRVTAVIAKGLTEHNDVTIVTYDKPESKDMTLYGLQKADIHYRFIAYPPKKKLKGKLCKAYSGIYLKLHLNSKWASDLYARSSFPSELRNVLLRELQQGNYDTIIGVHAPLAARLATLKNQLPGVKLIGWIHNSFEALFGATSLYIGTERKRHYIYQFRKLDDVVVLCNYDAEAFRQYDQEMITTVIYNPLTLEPGCISNGSSKRFLAVGRFSPKHKGIDLLIEAFALFAPKNKDWNLDIVGEGQEEQLYRQLIEKYQLQERVVIHPFTNNIQTFYSKASVYVLSSRWEGMPLVLVEAMSHGLPIVATDLPVCKEIMGDFGLYFKNGDIESLALQLGHAAQIEWPEKSKEAIEIAKRFDIGHIINQWTQLIEK